MLFGLFENQNEIKSRGVDMPGISSPGFGIKGSTALVTGACGQVGARLVEMLVERGATRVVAVDVQMPDENLVKRFGNKVICVCGPTHGDFTLESAMDSAFTKVARLNLVFHVGGLTGPFFDRNECMKVNYQGTLNMIEMCKKHKVPKLVFASTPTARFTGADITGQTEDQLPLQTEHWLIPYAESKALAEQAVQAAHSETLSTVIVSPHQVYGPHDNLFLSRILGVAGRDQLHIFGKGDTTISVTFVDNYTHGLLCGADALKTNLETVGGASYIVTDDQSVQLWTFINSFIIGLGFTDLESKIKLPSWLCYSAAYVANFIGLVTGRKLALTPFNVKMMTMHRYFDIRRAKAELKYSPIVAHDKAVAKTLEWFKTDWLVTFQQEITQQETKKVSEALPPVKPAKTLD